MPDAHWGREMGGTAAGALPLTHAPLGPPVFALSLSATSLAGAAAAGSVHRAQGFERGEIALAAVLDCVCHQHLSTASQAAAPSNMHLGLGDEREEGEKGEGEERRGRRGGGGARCARLAGAWQHATHTTCTHVEARASTLRRALPQACWLAGANVRCGWAVLKLNVRALQGSSAGSPSHGTSVWRAGLGNAIAVAVVVAVLIAGVEAAILAAVVVADVKVTCKEGPRAVCVPRQHVAT